MSILETKIEAQECRIRKIEQDNAATGVKIDNLLTTMNTLLGWVKTLVVSMLPVIGYLIKQFIEK